MNVNSPNTMIVHVIAIFSPSVWCSPLRVHWLHKKFCMEMWRRRSVPLVVLILYLNFFAAGIFFFYLKAKRSAFVCVAASLRRYPTLRVRGFGGQSFGGFPWLRGLWCIECAESSGVTCCALLALLLLLLSRVHRGSVWDVSAHAGGPNREDWVGLCWADTRLAHE